jgi:hypothetical protein
MKLTERIDRVFYTYTQIITLPGLLLWGACMAYAVSLWVTHGTWVWVPLILILFTRYPDELMDRPTATTPGVQPGGVYGDTVVVEGARTPKTSTHPPTAPPRARGGFRVEGDAPYPTDGQYYDTDKGKY